MAGSFQSGSLNLKKVGQRIAVAHVAGVGGLFLPVLVWAQNLKGI